MWKVNCVFFPFFQYLFFFVIYIYIYIELCVCQDAIIESSGIPTKKVMSSLKNPQFLVVKGHKEASKTVHPTNISRWWFQIFFIFTPTWGRFPFWLIFFRWVETTNQSSCLPLQERLNQLGQQLETLKLQTVEKLVWELGEFQVRISWWWENR